MEELKQSKLSGYLNLEFGKSKENNIWLTSSMTLRILVGALGMALPFLLYFFLLLDSSRTAPLESISHYYFTRVSGIFVAVISLMAVFLIIYKGPEPIDFILSTLAGICALVVVMFPTGNITNTCSDPAYHYSVTILKISSAREYVHYIAAGIFLASLAFMAIFIFTKTDKPKTTWSTPKKIRNLIYRVCGILMILAILVIFAGALGIIPEDTYNDHRLTYWMETVAVEGFGIAWFIKGGTIFKDHRSKVASAS